MTNIKVYNGNQIGGCITVISTDNTSIMIDFGEDLPSNIKHNKYNFDWSSNTIDAVLFTHYHGDHIGRFDEIPNNVSVYMGKLTRMIMNSIYKRVGNQEQIDILNNDLRIKEIKQNQTIIIGDIKITPYMIDHSAYDAYMYLIETPDKTILHTGDFRTHGYRGKAVIPLIKKYIRKNGKRDIDVLIVEGTTITRKSKRIYSENDMKKDAINLFKNQKYVFLICSSVNLDSLATFYQAAKSQHIKTYANRYVIEQLDNFSKTAGTMTDLYNFKYTYPVNFDKVIKSKKLKEDVTQEEFMRKEGFLIIIKPEEYCKEWIDRFADLKPTIVYSMWKGYVDINNKACIKEWVDFLNNYDDVVYMHTSGHITPEELIEVIKTVAPREAIIPIHTEVAEKFKLLDIGEYAKLVKIDDYIIGEETEYEKRN